MNLCGWLQEMLFKLKLDSLQYHEQLLLLYILNAEAFDELLNYSFSEGNL